LFGTLSAEQLEQQVAPAKKPPDLSVGTSYSGERRALAAAWHCERLHPELDHDVSFRNRIDRRTHGDGQSLKSAWEKINQKLWEGFAKFSPSDWAGRHTAVSEEEFKREPNRNKFTVSLRPDSAHVISRRAGDAGAAEA